MSLELSDASIVGMLPSGIGNLTFLVTLDLSGNQFIGEFPTQFLNTKTLQVFSIASNQLQGTIRSNAFENLTQLLTL
ncbi:hypothetical protein BDL97_04G009100 [Sphagnum fallax]|nr:hypothetical protein BDL97_04G009100 [Sphagnum fallax]